VASKTHAAHIGPDTNSIALTRNVRSDATRIGLLAKAEATATVRTGVTVTSFEALLASVHTRRRALRVMTST
jgi:hypothetical protein